MRSTQNIINLNKRTFESSKLYEALRTLNPSGRLPQSLGELSDLLVPLKALIPELAEYEQASEEAKRELPRTATGLTILGSLMRAGSVWESLKQPMLVQNRLVAGEVLLREFENFSRPQDPANRITFQQLTDIAKLFEPYATDADAIACIAISLVYGDLLKLPHIQQKLAGIVGESVVDHDLAIKEAFKSENIEKVYDVLPTLAGLPEEYQYRIQAEILHDANLGHILEASTCGVVLQDLKDASAEDPAVLDFWLLPTLLDIFGARADHTKPETWCGSVLANCNLVPAILTFADHLHMLHDTDVYTFYDAFQSTLAQSPYYKPIVNDAALNDVEKQVVFRLSRHFHWQTDSRDLDILIAEYKARPPHEKEVLERYFLNDGSNPDDPKAVITYFPYLFSQAYAKHLPEATALRHTLTSLTSLLFRIEEYEAHFDTAPNDGMRVYAGQNVWFKTLRPMTVQDALSGGVRLAIAHNEGTPEVIPEMTILLRNPEIRKTTLETLQRATEKAFKVCQPILFDKLSPSEKEAFTFVDGHSFTDGSWYRPIHNVIVPYAMLEICNETSASSDLVLAAILHDVGYAGLKLPGTLSGSAWDTKDARESHMAASAVMSRTFLNELRDKGAVDLSDERIDKLVDIIATHDNPYIGKPLEDREALLHRDADRAFVISAVSFWKDYIAYLSDERKMPKFSDSGVVLSPQQFLKLREASFLSDESNEMSRYTTYEPMQSSKGKAIAQVQYQQRLRDIPSVLAALSPAAGNQGRLEELFTQMIIDDFNAIARAK